MGGMTEYNKAVPGLAARLIDALESENKYRREEDAKDRQTNRELAKDESRYQRLGLQYAFRITITGLLIGGAVAIFGAAFGQPAAAIGGSVFGSLNLVGLASVFAIGR
jgi:uncharacterized membrane protein